MTKEYDDAHKRLMAELTQQRSSSEDRGDNSMAGAAAGSIFGGVQHFSGNVIFMGEATPGTIEKVLSKRTGRGT